MDLIKAAAHRHLEVCKLLLENGANVHANKDWALQHAARNGHLEVCKLLLENGANVHADNNYALRCATSERHTEVCKLLLEYGADLTVFRTKKFNLMKTVKEFATKEQIEQARKTLSIQKVMSA
jgi:ankyrin repeat protein